MFDGLTAQLELYTLPRFERALEFFSDWHAEDKYSGAIRPMELWPAQVDLLKDIADKTHSNVCLKARQVGWTTLIAGFCAMVAVTESNREIGIVSMREADAKKILKKKILPGLGKLAERWNIEYSVTATAITFSNGSIIEAFPATNPARGRTMDILVLDEFTHMENQDAVIAAADPATERGKLIILSTSNGPNDKFHSICIAALKLIGRFRLLFKGWDADPNRNQEWWESKGEAEGWSRKFYQEFPSSIEEAFLKGGSTYFNSDDMTRQLLWVKPPRLVTIDDNYALSDGVPTDEGVLELFELPKKDETYFIGSDVALGVANGDFSSFHVLASSPRRVVMKGNAHWDPIKYAHILNRVGRLYGDALLAVEVNNQGLSVIEELRSLRYPQLYTHLVPGRRGSQTRSKFGFNTTRDSKRLICTNLRSDIERTLRVNSESTLVEMAAFTEGDNGVLEGRPHDDDVMSLAIANYVAKTNRGRPTRAGVDPSDIPGTLAWHRKHGRQARLKSPGEVVAVIGRV